MKNATQTARMPFLSYCKELLRLMRPFQWWKNGFVFVGLFFGHAWNDIQLLTAAVTCACAFALVSSGVYIINDIVDCEADRHHPKKKNRPLASGTVSLLSANLLASVCWIGGLGLAWSVSSMALALILTYAILNIAYSLFLKHVVIIDAFVISAGFILRVLVGTIGIGIPASQWLLLCTLMLTLFLAFTKRRAELLVMQEAHEPGRQVLSQYTPELLDNLISITATATILCYSLYTTNPETIRVHQTPNLIMTVPVVTYGMFRYMYLLHRWKAGENPAQELLGDSHMVVTVVIYAVLTICLIW